jgi:hypothetical protein
MMPGEQLSPWLHEKGAWRARPCAKTLAAHDELFAAIQALPSSRFEG